MPSFIRIESLWRYNKTTWTSLMGRNYTYVAVLPAPSDQVDCLRYCAILDDPSGEVELDRRISKSGTFWHKGAGLVTIVSESAIELDKFGRWTSHGSHCQWIRVKLPQPKRSPPPGDLCYPGIIFCDLCGWIAKVTCIACPLFYHPWAKTTLYRLCSPCLKLERTRVGNR